MTSEADRWVAFLNQPRHVLTLIEAEAMLAEGTWYPDECSATCPLCDGWGNLATNAPACPACQGKCILTVPQWRTFLKDFVATHVT